MSIREKVTSVGEKALTIMDEYFEGKREGTDKVQEASKMITQAIKVEHMNQIQRNTDRSFGLRLLGYLPKDEKVRNKYIEMTNPEIKGLLIGRPEKKN